MSVDRRVFDPFAPAPAAAEAPGTGNDPDPGETTPDPDPESGDELGDLLKPELIKLAGDYGLPTSGTKDELITRIRDHRATLTP